jgi:uroporphyrinogen decarboxylase
METMTSKERVRIALNHQIPDRVPLCADFVPEAAEALEKRLGVSDYYDMLVALGNDMLVASAGISTVFYGQADENGEYVCPWGNTWKYFNNKFGSYTEVVKHALANDEDGSLLEAYRIPDPLEESQYDKLKEIIKKYGETHFICGSLACSIFEASWYTSGLVNVLEKIAIDPDYANALFDKMMEFPLKSGQKMIDLGVDMLWLGDDVGMQNRMMMSPDTWREYLKPRMKKLISTFKNYKPEVKVAYHSCGYIKPIIPDLIEIGLDVLNPIQPMAMDPAEIKTEFGDKLSFWGSICIQNTLPNGSALDIQNEVKLRMDTIGKGGGFIMGPAHNVQADTSVENILAFYEAAKEFGRYY